ncbi:MAG: UTP--glucose-1-phosphate uridylyltransferase GalU [Synergistota bacterium]|jgi:UTP--glucose-1-phosphate uridylyltransferase|nr:UTP--glucose-1-phosphate uridylyltransferase GalU [Synergistota bacterium]OPZ39658.1 MAG: UTP--glucose-1-phosphate uridylyltransferase [Synergistetes bacterium ADurb.BinA166]
MSASITKCLFPVAGLGTRFLPATKEIAKEMLPLVDRPIIEYGVDEAVGSGCREMVMITGRSKKAIEDHFDRSFELEELLKSRNKESLYNEVVSRSTRADFIYLRQHRPLGLGHAVLCGEPVCRNEYFGVILPDDVMVAETPVLSQLIEVHKARGGCVLALEEVPEADTARYGIVVAESAGDGVFAIRDMVEKPGPERAPSRLAIMGRYILSPGIFPLLSAQGTGAGGEIQLTDGIRAIIGAEPVWGLLYRGRRFDCGTQVGWLDANISLAMEHPALREVVLEAVRRCGERNSI